MKRVFGSTIGKIANPLDQIIIKGNLGMDKAIFLYSVALQHLRQQQWNNQETATQLKRSRFLIWVPTALLLLQSIVLALDNAWFGYAFGFIILPIIFFVAVGWSSLSDHLSKSLKDEQALQEIGSGAL